MPLDSWDQATDLVETHSNMTCLKLLVPCISYTVVVLLVLLVLLVTSSTSVVLVLVLVAAVVLEVLAILVVEVVEVVIVAGGTLVARAVFVL